MDFPIVLMFLWTLCGVHLKAMKLNIFKDSDCSKTLLEGDTYTIMLNSPKQDGDSLVWKCDITIIYERRNGTVKGSADVDDRGSLTLKNVTTAMACTYQAQHWSDKPSHLKSLTTKICVVPKVPVPTLTVVCSSSGEGTLHCEPGGTKGFSSLSWFHNNREMKEKVNPFTPTLHGASDQYRCRLTNDKSKEDEEDSNDVTISCSKPAKCKEKVEGDSHVISVDLPSSDSRSSLIWKCNETVIYSTNGRERAPFPLSVDKNGVLLLTKLSAAMSCTYTAEYVIDKRTGRKATKTEALCVLPRAPVPKLTGKCSDTGKVSLHCDPKPPAGFKLSWLINNKEVNDSSNPFLPGPQQTGGKDVYRCRLSSSLSIADSNAITTPCKDTGSQAEVSQLCVNKRAVLLVLAVAALIVLILTLSLVIVSCKYRRLKRRKIHEAVYEHVRLASVTRTDAPNQRVTTPDATNSNQKVTTPDAANSDSKERPPQKTSPSGEHTYANTQDPQGNTQLPQREAPSPAASQPRQGTPKPPRAAAAAAAGAGAGAGAGGERGGGAGAGGGGAGGGGAGGERQPETPVPQPRKKLNVTSTNC